MRLIPGSEATQSATWGTEDIGDLTGRVALVTGANSGIGYETAKALADHGAHVILACRDEEKARRARDKLESELDRSSLELVHLDLADLVSVHRAADAVLRDHARLDIVVNNAGVMGAPYRLTGDGFELHMATNHLGHFALTGLLLDRVVTTERSRIVTVSSHMHRTGRLRLEDVAGIASRHTWVSYGTSKLANLLFSAELSRRLEAAGLSTLAVAAHPGWARSNLAANGAALERQPPAAQARADRRSDVRAVGGGGCPPDPLRRDLLVGPVRGLHRPGAPVRSLRATPDRPCVGRARDREAMAGLWRASEELTGVLYSVPAPV